MKHNSKLLVVAVGLSAVLSVSCVSPSYAAEDINDVSAADVAEALAGMSPGLIEPAADASTTATAAAVVDNGTTVVSIPRDPTAGVDLTMGASSVSIGLPESESASQAVPLDSGAITYPTDNGTANTVVPLADGVQMLTTITSSDAPSSLAYDVIVPVGGSITVTDEGAALITDAHGETLLTTSAPWAVDAKGAAVPTHYEVEDNRLVQVIMHTTGDYAYPIVADPTWGWRNAAWGLTLSRSETASIKDYAAAAGMCATIAKKAAAFAVACGAWASYLQIQAATANRLSPKGCLHVVVAPLPGAISHTRC